MVCACESLKERWSALRDSLARQPFLRQAIQKGLQARQFLGLFENLQGVIQIRHEQLAFHALDSGKDGVASKFLGTKRSRNPCLKALNAFAPHQEGVLDHKMKPVPARHTF